jgi:type II secretory pathway pseudopilin PulG
MRRNLRTQLPARPRTPCAVRRTGFSIVEALIALALMGVAGGLLAATFTVAGAARRSAALQAQGAAVLRTRIALLSRRPCSAADTSGVDQVGGARDAWRAQRVDAGWEFTDSVAVPGAAPKTLTGRVRCR